MPGNEHEILTEVRRTVDGLEFLRRMITGELPASPMASLLGIRVIEAAEGRTVYEADPLPVFYNALGTIHGGFAATLLDTALGAAVNTMMGPGRSYATIDLKITLLRPIRRDVGTIRCIATAIQTGSRLATAEGRIIDANDKLYAHGTATFMTLEPPRP